MTLAYIVMAYIVMAYIGIAYIVMAYIVMAWAEEKRPAIIGSSECSMADVANSSVDLVFGNPVRPRLEM